MSTCVSTTICTKENNAVTMIQASLFNRHISMDVQVTIFTFTLPWNVATSLGQAITINLRFYGKQADIIVSLLKRYLA
jgi:hypothetical protein